MVMRIPCISTVAASSAIAEMNAPGYGRKRRNDVLDNGRDIGDNILERFHHVIDELLHIGVGSAEAVMRFWICLAFF